MVLLDAFGSGTVGPGVFIVRVGERVRHLCFSYTLRDEYERVERDTSGFRGK